MMMNLYIGLLCLISSTYGRAQGETTITFPSNNFTVSQTSYTRCLVPAQPSTTRDDYWYTAGIGAHKLHTRAATWNEARRTCEEEGGHLAVINSIAEANAIAEIFKKSEAITGSPHPDFAAIGFHDLFKEGEYVTIHGQSIARAGYNRWAGPQPDNAGGNENCGSVYRTGHLNDINCQTPFGFVCELPL